MSRDEMRCKKCDDANDPAKLRAEIGRLRAALKDLLSRAEDEICDPIDVPEIQQARAVLGDA